MNTKNYQINTLAHGVRKAAVAQNRLGVRTAATGIASLAALTFSALSAAQSLPVETVSQQAIDEVVVLGRGESRQVQSVVSDEIAKLPAGTNPLKAIEKMPGVNFQSADPFGNYEWSSRISIRGFDRNRLGFTLDGIPLGDMTYGNHNGLHISRAIPTEMVERVELSQGSGSLDTASTSNLGGTVKFFSMDPADSFGFTANQMFGSDSAQHTFLKLDSGELPIGTRLSVAIADASTEKWKGAGEQEQRKYAFKAVQPIGEAQVTAFYNTSDRAEIDYQDISKDLVQRRGWEWDNWYPNWDGAVAAADDCATSTVCDDAYWNAAGLRKDDLGYVGLAMPFNESVTWNIKYYTHQNEGQGLWATPYVASPGGAPLSVRTTEYDIDRSGLVTDIEIQLGNHVLSFGAWIEDNDFIQARRFYAEPSRLAPQRDFSEFQSNPFRTDWEYNFTTETMMYFVQDAWNITDSVRLDLGFRAIESENAVVTNEALTIPAQVKSGQIEAKDSFLPQLGINWSFSDNAEWFASYAENIRTFASSGTSGPFSTNAAGFVAIRDTLQPETSTNLETGIRFKGDAMEALVAAYAVKFSDRLLGIQQGLSIVGNPSVLANVGAVEIRGIEAAVNWQLTDQLTWFISAAYTLSEYADNYTTTAVVDDVPVPTVVPVAGKQVTDTPEILLKSEISWEVGGFFLRADVNYTDERFYTYLNEGGVDDYALFNAGVGYNFANLGPIDSMTLQLDATNLTDKEYFSTIDSAGFGVTDAGGTRQTLLRGAPRQFFLSAKFNF